VEVQEWNADFLLNVGRAADDSPRAVCTRSQQLVTLDKFTPAYSRNLNLFNPLLLLGINLSAPRFVRNCFLSGGCLRSPVVKLDSLPRQRSQACIKSVSKKVKKSAVGMKRNFISTFVPIIYKAFLLS
jgi:hypothetical protein